MGLFKSAIDKALEQLEKKADKVEDSDSEGSLNEIINNGIGETFNILSGASIKKDILLPDNVIGFIGASGGVGTSTIVANTALQLTRSGYSVLIIDCNVLYPIQYSYVGYKASDIHYDFCSFLYGEKRLSDVIQNKNDIHLLTCKNRTIMDFINLDTEDRANEIDIAIQRLRILYDIILLDIPNLIVSELVNMMIYKCDRIHIIWNESIDCITNTERLIKNLTISGIETSNKIDIILNQRTSVPYSKYPFNILDIEIIAVIPFDSSVIECALKGGIYIRDGYASNRNSKVIVKNIKIIAYNILIQGGHSKAE